jgi:ribulose-5-phosphate 4-epimerase/fuculose-1-phosphate aldolase
MTESVQSPQHGVSAGASGALPIGASVADGERTAESGVSSATEQMPRVPSFATELEAREAIVAMMRSLAPLGLNQGKSGNASLRWHRGGEPGMLVTPSALPYDQLGPDDLVWMPLDQQRDGPAGRRGSEGPGEGEGSSPFAYGRPRAPVLGPVPTDGLSLPPRFDGPHAPSSEWLIHLDLHNARPDAQAVLHLHSPYATTLACSERVQGEGVPSFHYMVAVAGGPDLRCAPYATFGTSELSVATLAALEGRRACLMAHHGMIAIGAGLRQVLDLAIEVESLCRIYWQALAIGEPPQLGEDEMKRVLARFADYGRVRSGRNT